MALKSQSLIVYGLQVTILNQNLDFVSSSGSHTAVIPLGFYSVTSIADIIATQMGSTDTSNTYTVTVDRTILGGTQNRVTISSNGTLLTLKFATGPNAATTIAGLIGFNATDYTGSTSYSGSQSCGTALIPDYIGYSYCDDFNTAKLFGAVNVAASGLKESVTFNIQYFLEIIFQFEAKARLTLWKSFFLWAIQQRPFDFTPEISDPNTFYQVTLESTSYDAKGLGYQMKEMLPNFPNYYSTDKLKFRILEQQSEFISVG